METQITHLKTKYDFVTDQEGHYDMDGVSFGCNEVIVASDAKKVQNYDWKRNFWILDLSYDRRKLKPVLYTLVGVGIGLGLVKILVKKKYAN